MVREVNERERNSRAKSVRGIIKDIIDLGEELEMYQEEAGTSRAALSYAKAKVCRLDFDINRVRERSEWTKAYQKADIDRAECNRKVCPCNQK